MEIDISAPEPVKKTILDTGLIDGESLKVSKIQNEKRAESRKKIKAAGMNTTAYGMGVKVAKMMLNQGERDDFIRDFLVTVDVLTKVQVELFPDLAMIADRKRTKLQEREAKKAAAAGGETPEAQQRRLAADANPKSKPKATSAVQRAVETSERNQRLAEVAGGAVAEPGTSPSLSDTVAAGDALIAKTAAELTAEQEQRDGAALLNRNPDGTPKSQTQLSAEALERAKLDKVTH